MNNNGIKEWYSFQLLCEQKKDLKNRHFICATKYGIILLCFSLSCVRNDNILLEFQIIFITNYENNKCSNLGHSKTLRKNRHIYPSLLSTAVLQDHPHRSWQPEMQFLQSISERKIISTPYPFLMSSNTTRTQNMAMRRARYSVVLSWVSSIPCTPVNSGWQNDSREKWVKPNSWWSATQNQLKI